MANPQAAVTGNYQDMGDDAGADPSAAATPGDQDEGDGSYVIEIRVGADKQITVCVEQGAEEAGEEQASDAGGGAQGAQADQGDYGDTGGDDKSVPVKSIKEGLTLALEIYRADGVLPGNADDDFQAGFEGANK